MAKTGWQSLIMDPTDWADAGKIKVDPAVARRAKAVKAIDAVLTTIEAGAPPSKMGLYKIKANLARATLRLGRNTVMLDGAEFAIVPLERVGDFYMSLKDDIEGGKLDAELAAAAGEELPVEPVKRRGRKPKAA